MQRPALLIALCYLGGLLTAHYLPIPAGGFTTSTLAALLAAGWGLRKSGGTRTLTALLCFGVFSTGGFWYTVRIRAVPESDLRRYGDRTERIVLYGTVDRDPELRNGYTLVSLAADSAQFEAVDRRIPMTGRLLVRLYAQGDPGAYGDRIRVSGWLRRPSPARNPGGFDAWTFYTSQGIYGLMSVQDTTAYRILKRRSSPTFHTAFILPLKQHIEHTIEATLRGESAALLKGLLLGQRQQLPEDLLAAFSTTGLTHILSVSGLHVGLITLILMTLFSVLRLPHPAAVAATLLVLLLYACITNLTPSVVRASIMGGLFLTGRLLDRQTDGVNILGVAGLGILVLWPAAAFDLSFQLSFVATLSIIAGYPRLKVLLPGCVNHSQAWWARWLRDGLAVSLAAQLGTAPILAFAFFQVSWVAPVANLFVAPLVFASTTLGVLTVLAGAVSLGLAGLFSAANWLALQGMIRVSVLFAGIPSASMPVPRPPMTVILAFYAVCLLLVWPPRSRPIRRGLTAAAVSGFIVAGGLWCVRPHGLEITVLDVGQGDAVFIECPNRRTILIDGGLRTPDYDPGERIILPFLRAKGHRRIDTVMVTHPHADHYGGLAAVLEGVAVGEVVTTGMTADTPGFRMWQDVLVRKRIRHRAALEGDRLQGLGEVSAVVLHPSPAFMNAHGIEQANDASLVVRLTYGTFSMLFTGDIETDAEHTLTAKAHTLRATVLKVPHHGSPTSSTPGFVAAVRPQAAIISVGARNPFRHPSRQVIDRYLGYKTTVYRTDRAGGVIVRTDGRVWSAEQTLSSTWHPVWMTPAQVLESICLTGVFRSSILRRTG